MSKKKKMSAQDSIPFERMWQDGICRVKPGYFTKTVMFRDINYQLNQNEDKTTIFDGWCDFLNYFKRLGVTVAALNGHDRLSLMHGMFHMDEQIPFRFSWDWLAPSGLSVKDFIAPSSFEFRNGKTFGGRKEAWGGILFTDTRTGA